MCEAGCNFDSSSVFSSAKSSHPKKTGSATKAAPSSAPTARTRTSKDAGAAAQSDGTEARSNRKSDTSSSVPHKASTVTSSRPGDVKSSYLFSGRQPASSTGSGAEAQGARGEQKNKSASNAATRAVPDSDNGSQGTVKSPHVNPDTEDTSFTEEETDKRGEKAKKTSGGEDEKTGKMDPTEQKSHR